MTEPEESADPPVTDVIRHPPTANPRRTRVAADPGEEHGEMSGEPDASGPVEGAG